MAATTEGIIKSVESTVTLTDSTMGFHTAVRFAYACPAVRKRNGGKQCLLMGGAADQTSGELSIHYFWAALSGQMCPKAWRAWRDVGRGTVNIF